MVESVFEKEVPAPKKLGDASPSAKNGPASIPDKKAVEQKLLDTICELFDLDEKAITPTSHLRDDLGIDSLCAIELLMAVEEKFDLDLAVEAETQFLTVKQFSDHVWDCVSAKKQASTPGRPASSSRVKKVLGVLSPAGWKG